MASCTFFGHRDTPDQVKPALHQAITELILKKDVSTFYVGNQGNFDRMTISVLRNLSQHFSIQWFIVLAYFPKTPAPSTESLPTLLPEGIEEIHPKYAIAFRNRWMLQNSDYVVTYTRRTYGGAAQFEALAQRKGKTLIKL